MRKIIGFTIILILLMIPGSLTRTNANPSTNTFGPYTVATTGTIGWDSVDEQKLPMVYNAAGGITVTFTGIDMSSIDYRGDMGWPPSPDDLGAFGMFGIKQTSDSNNRVWYNILNNLATNGKGSWDNQGYKYISWQDIGGKIIKYRSYLFQGWYGNPQVNPGGNHQYNAESYVVPNPLHPLAAGTGNPSDYNKIDLKLVITPEGSDYRVTAYHRLQRAASFDEGVWWDHWNPAGNDPNSAHRGWQPMYGGSWLTSGINLKCVVPFIAVSNWQYAAPGASITVDSVEVTGNAYQIIAFETDSSTMIPAGGSATLKVLVTDETGPAVGVPVKFESEPALTFNNPYYTDPSGIATVTLLSIPAELYTIKASICGTLYDEWTLVVYDASGMAAGGGWFIPLQESGEPMDGTANFGFIAKYIKGKSTGNIEFQYKAAEGFNLKSINIDYLVVTGGNIAQFGGTATLDGDEGYYFRAKAIDNAEPGIGVDVFWIKIWEGDINAAETTDPWYNVKNTLSGGNIMVKIK